MPQLLGEFECAVDAKGRLRMPTQLIRKLGVTENSVFVINRGFEKNLMLYPKEVWDAITKEVNKLNLYNQKNREFVRYFYRGASELEIDGQDRLLLSKRLMEYAGIEKEAVIFAYNDRMEIWAKDEFDKLMNDEPSDFSNLAQDVLGNNVSDNLHGE
jgi:MraZ protein